MSRLIPFPPCTHNACPLWAASLRKHTNPCLLAGRRHRVGGPTIDDASARRPCIRALRLSSHSTARAWDELRSPSDSAHIVRVAFAHIPRPLCTVALFVLADLQSMLDRSCSEATLCTYDACVNYFARCTKRRTRRLCQRPLRCIRADNAVETSFLNERVPF